MPIPRVGQAQEDILNLLKNSGGSLTREQVVKSLKREWALTAQEEAIKDPAGGIHYLKTIDGAATILRRKGEIDSPQRGVWAITDKGRQRIGKGSEQLPPPPPAPPKRHEELKQMMVEIGKKLGYSTGTEEGPEFRHDVVWRTTPYKTPSRVIEICDGGSLPKDFASLNWANQNWDARGILIVTDGNDFEKATRQLSYHPRIIVVKAETVDRLHELLMTDLELLKSIFSEQL